MAVLSREEFFEALQNRMGSDSSNESIEFMENMTDTYNDLETRANTDAHEWEQKYKDNDAAWRARYKHRFFSGDGGRANEREIREKDSLDISIDELFK